MQGSRDQTLDGNTFHILSVIDEFIKKCPAFPITYYPMVQKRERLGESDRSRH